MNAVRLAMKFTTPACLILIFGVAAAMAGERIIEFNDMELDDLKFAGFEMKEKGEVKIYGVGAISSYNDRFFALGWIIDADDRDLIWSMNEDCYDYSRLSDILGECEDIVALRPGRYEVYYYVGRPNLILGDGHISINDLGDLLGLIGDAIKFDDDEDTRKIYDEDIEELTFTISTEARASTYTPTFERPENTIVSFDRVEADELHSYSFTLSKDMALDIYAIGEYSDSYEIFADGAWIRDADSREIVWRMDKWNTRRAGGADKNRYFRDEISLPSGDYVAYFATDDSHDFGRWNMTPPFDPINYGITIMTTEPDDMRFVTEYTDQPTGSEILSLTRPGDNDFKKEGLALKRDTRILIKAYGERDYSKEGLVDYGWIVNAVSLDKVWEMDYDKSVIAGGHVKNCYYEGVIDLPPGDYMVYYRTDGSHSFDDWNASPPKNQRDYGITLYAVDRLSEDDYEIVDRFHPTGNVLVDLTGLGDDEQRSQKFTLENTVDIRVMAIGEGKSNHMYDYGWIEDENGEIIWEMTYRKTYHAGGASKNRIVVANITLRPGKYTARFVTDDSHSYRGFNASPPDEPERWGMVITQK